MVPDSPSIPPSQTGGYDVAGPAKTGAIGSILRASFRLSPDEVEYDLNRLLAVLDRTA